MDSSSEVQKIFERYSKRSLMEKRYSPLAPSTYLREQEKERKIINCIKRYGFQPLESKTLLEIGAGNGNNILFFLKLGMKPENIVVNELLPDRIISLKNKLPVTVRVLEGNALDLSLADKTFVIVTQSMVFTSILDEEFKKALAEKMWSLTHPGGGILWYDFIYNNPNNNDVKGIKLKDIKALFPEGEILKWRLTLAPPLARMIERYPFLYNFLNIFPFLQTHLLCLIRKK